MGKRSRQFYKGYNEFIIEMDKYLPEQCTPEDLVRFGVFGSLSALSARRKSGMEPYFSGLGNDQYIYEKRHVMDFLRTHERFVRCYKKKIAGDNGRVLQEGSSDSIVFDRIDDVTKNIEKKFRNIERLIQESDKKPSIVDRICSYFQFGR